MGTTQGAEGTVSLKLKKFETLNDILEDIQFNSFALEEMNLVRKSHNVAPPKGFRWKRDAYDQLCDNGQFTLDYLKKEFPDIVLKKSILPGTKRNLIERIMLNAVRKTYKFYSDKDNDIKDLETTHTLSTTTK